MGDGEVDQWAKLTDDWDKERQRRFGIVHKVLYEDHGLDKDESLEFKILICLASPPFVREKEYGVLPDNEKKIYKAIFDQIHPGWEDRPDEVWWAIHRENFAKAVYCRLCKHWVFDYGRMTCMCVRDHDAHHRKYEWWMNGDGYCKAFKLDKEKSRGESKEDAIIIFADNTKDGIKVEGDWLQEKKGVLTFMTIQSLIEDKETGKWYDRFDFESKSYWFDITAFFGK